MHKSPKKSCTAHYPLSAAVDMHRDALKSVSTISYIFKFFLRKSVYSYTDFLQYSVFVMQYLPQFNVKGMPTLS